MSIPLSAYSSSHDIKKQALMQLLLTVIVRIIA
jgi:hypothetical protein